MIAAGRAFAAGVSAVVRAPGLLIAVCVATVLAVVPFGIVMVREIQSALAHQPAIDLAAQEIDPEWWIEYRRHATGLASTFTPAILGFAAPLEALSGLLDGTPRPWALAAPLALSAVVWAFLWGVSLERFHRTQRLGIRAASSAGAYYFLPFVLITVISGAAVLALYWTIHVWLFGPAYEAISARAGSEPMVFAGRILLYLIFGVALASISLAADYTRVALVAHRMRSVRSGFHAALQFARGNFTAVVFLVLVTGVAFAALFVAFGVADTRFGGWRAVILGQAFIVSRLALRLVAAASQMDLYKRLTMTS